MKLSALRWTCLALAGAATGVVNADEAKREMNVNQGPESVFSVAVGEIFPELDVARATDRNGRVGNELVFWGYTLADGRNVELVACTVLGNVDCEARTALVCPGGLDVLSQGTAPGLVRRMHCTSIATVGAGDRRPGCSDRSTSQELVVSLVQCR